MLERQRPYGRSEAIVLTEVGSAVAVTMDQLVVRLPQLSWTEVFSAVDALSRRGEIRIRRRGSAYELSLPHLRQEPESVPESAAKR